MCVCMWENDVGDGVKCKVADPISWENMARKQKKDYGLQTIILKCFLSKHKYVRIRSFYF